MSDARVAERPLDPEAIAAADAAVEPYTGGRPIKPGDTRTRRKWMDAYIAAGGKVRERTPRRRRSSDICETCPNVPITVEVVELEFLSDHGVLKSQDAAWTNDGTLFEPPDWRPETQNPISTSMLKRLELRVDVQVGPDGAAPETGRLIGKVGGKVAFDTGRVTFKPGTTQSFRLRSSHRIKPLIREAELVIEWKALTKKTMTTWTAVGTTTNERWFTTFGPPIENADNPEDGVTLQRLFVAADWVGAAESVGHVKILDQLFGQFNRYVLSAWDEAREHVVESTLPAPMLKELEEKPELRKQLADVDWPGYFNTDVGTWPIPEHLDWGAECQAICRLIRGMLRQLGSRRDIRLVYITADFDRPESPMYCGVSKNRRTGTKQPYEPTGPYADHEYALADRPVTTKTYWPPAVGETTEVGWNNFEAYLRYRYTSNGSKRTRWWGGGVGRIKAGSNPLHVFKALVEYKNVSRTITVGDDEREEWGREVTRIHAYQK